MACNDGEWCPLIGKECKRHKCAWYTRISGTDPQTGRDIDDYGCAVSFMPMLAINIGKETYSAGAAVESFRNEVVHHSQVNQQLYLHSLEQQALVPPVVGIIESEEENPEE
jgi:hypothetical protein